MDFFKKIWVEILMLALSGFTKVELTPVLEGTFCCS